MVQAEFCAIVNCQIATQNSKMKYFNLTKLGSIKFLEKQSHSENIGMKKINYANEGGPRREGKEMSELVNCDW